MRERGTGSVYRPTWIDKKTGERRESPYWHIRYSLDGELKREKTKTTDEEKAKRILGKRLDDHAEGRASGPQIDKTTTGDLFKGVTVDYTVNKRKSLRRVEDSINHLKAFFGDKTKARAVDAARISEYVEHRQKEGAGNGTINRELTALKRAFRLAAISGRVAHVPHISMLKEPPARAGFVERDQMDAILSHLPEPVRVVVLVAYLTGWRLASEVLTRQWRHVDFAGGYLILEPGETKTGQPRRFPLLPELREVLEAQRRHTDDVERERGQIVPQVFHRHGKPIHAIRKAWDRACAKAGLPGLIPHDMRRSAVRNLERAAVPRATAMKMVGHQTESVYRRYCIVDEAMLREGAEKLAAYHAIAKTVTRKVVPIKTTG